MFHINNKKPITQNNDAFTTRLAGVMGVLCVGPGELVYKKKSHMRFLATSLAEARIIVPKPKSAWMERRARKVQFNIREKVGDIQLSNKTEKNIERETNQMEKEATPAPVKGRAIN